MRSDDVLLHCVRDIRSLDQMLNDDGRLAIDFQTIRFFRRRSAESSFPTSISEVLELFVDDIRRHDSVDDKLTEAVHLVVVGVHDATQVLEAGVHEKVPRDIDGVLLSDTLSLVDLSNVSLFLDQLGIRYSSVVDIVNQSGKDTRELGKGVRRDSVRVIVQLVCEVIHVVRLVSDAVRSNNSRQQLDDTHCDVRRMLEVMERVVVVHARHDGDVVTNLGLDSSWELNRLGVYLAFGCRHVELWKFDDFLHFIDNSLTFLAYNGVEAAVADGLPLVRSISASNDMAKKSAKNVGVPVDQSLFFLVVRLADGLFLRDRLVAMYFFGTLVLDFFRIIVLVVGRGRLSNRALQLKPVGLHSVLTLRSKNIMSLGQPMLFSRCNK